MRARRALLGLGVACALLLSLPIAAASAATPVQAPPVTAAPPAPAAQPTAPSSGTAAQATPAPSQDTLGQLGGDSPSTVAQGVTGAAAQNYQQSKSLSRPYPLDNYGLDNWVQIQLTDFASPDTFSHLFDDVTQWIVTNVWAVMLFVFNGVLLILEWAFSLTLNNDVLSKLASALQAMHNAIITPWGLAAIGFLALWGIWNGLLRGRTIDTFRGLAASLAAMVIVLVLIANPVGTIGSATSISNGASMEMLNSVTGQTVSPGYQGLANAEAGPNGLFDALVLRPWCVLQFGDVNYCLSQPGGMNQSVADTWLHDQPGGNFRKALYYLTLGKAAPPANTVGGALPGLLAGAAPTVATAAHLGNVNALANHPEKVRLQGTGFTMARVALLVLILIGMLGGICLFFWIALRLVMAALFTLILTLFAPAMFLVAAGGEAGRLTFVGWGKRWIGAFLEKVVAALFLAVVIDAMNLVAALNLGFYATWIVYAAMWWTLLLHRKDLLGLVRVDHRGASPAGIDFDGARSGRGLAEMYFASRLVSQGVRGARRVAGVATAPAQAVLRTAGADVAAEKTAGRAAESDAARDMAREELETTARTTIDTQRQDEYAEEGRTHRPILREADRRHSLVEQAESGLADERNRRQRILDHMTAAGRGTPAWIKGHKTLLDSDKRIQGWQKTLSTRESDRDAFRATPALQEAQNHARRQPQAASPRDVNEWIGERRTQIEMGPAAPENLRAAGVPSSRHQNPLPADLESSQEKMHRDRRLLGIVGSARPGGEGPTMRPADLYWTRKDAEEQGKEDEYRDRTADKLPQRRAEVHQRRRDRGHRQTRRGMRRR